MSVYTRVSALLIEFLKKPDQILLKVTLWLIFFGSKKVTSDLNKLHLIHTFLLFKTRKPFSLFNQFSLFPMFLGGIVLMLLFIEINVLQYQLYNYIEYN